MYHLFVYVPEDFVEILKDTLFNIGVGKFGKYSHCVWQTDGEGQFKPLSESSPVIGNINQISKIKEIKLEFYCVLCAKYNEHHLGGLRQTK